MPSLHIIYASTSGHTAFVIETLAAWLKQHSSSVTVSSVRAELAQSEDFLKGDVLMLASSTWNTGGPEGQLNPHMFALLERAATVDLKGKKVAVIGLGDDRYRYTAKAADHLIEFVRAHHGEVIEPVLRIINEPYTQEKKVQEWASLLAKQF